jgi:hypothetical protein
MRGEGGTGPPKGRRLRRIRRRLERILLGSVMAVAAFVIERRVLKAIKKGSVKPVPSEPSGVAVRSDGSGGMTVTPDHIPGGGRPED